MTMDGVIIFNEWVVLFKTKKISLIEREKLC